jgi:ABC-type phosphate transport system substrate-binding protein
MMSRRVASLIVAAVCAWTVPIRAESPQSARAGDLAIVVHPETPVTQLTFAELRQVFVGDRQYWTRDMPVVLLIRAPATAEREAVLKTIYRMTEAQFKQFWIAKIFRAETATPPKIVYSSDATNQLVEAVPGAIAFMGASDVRPGLKVLRIDGRLPGETGYPLHLINP